MNQELKLQCGEGSLERRKGIYVVQLRGSYEEMGRQHAELAKQVCGDVVLQYFNHMNESLMAHSSPALAGIAGRLLKWWFHLRNRRALGPRLRTQLGAFAETFDVRPIDAERIYLVPDIVHWLMGRFFPPFAAPPSCSSFFACGGATRDGRVLMGRNFDFFGRGVWNANNAIITMHPTGGQSYCWLGALSVPGSAQGFNESGLFIWLHTQFQRDVQTVGEPVFKLCHDILADCRTLDEATRVILAGPRLVGLTLFMVDPKRRTAKAVGFSARHSETIWPENDIMAQTNHYLTPEMDKLTVLPYAWRRNTVARRQRIIEQLEAKRGALTAADIPAILSDCRDIYEGRKQLSGNIVAGLNNAQSMAFSPEEDLLWLANGDFPVCHAERFAGFRISALLAGDAARYEADDLRGGSPLEPDERAALAEYAEAWSAHNDQHNDDLSVFHLRRAAELAPNAEIFPRMAGLVLLKQKKYRQALPLLLRNTEFTYADPLVKAESHLWVGRCLDLMGRRAEAADHYRQAAEPAVAPVSDAARRHLQKPYSRWQLFNAAPEFVVASALWR